MATKIKKQKNPNTLSFSWACKCGSTDISFLADHIFTVYIFCILAIHAMTVLLIVCQIFMKSYLDKRKMIIYLLEWNWKWRWFFFEHWIWSSYLFWAVINILPVSAYTITSSLFIHEPNLSFFSSQFAIVRNPPAVAVISKWTI